jgi:hypothetical protein
MQLDGRTDFFFCPFVWSLVSGLMRFCDGTASDLFKSEVLGIPWQLLEKCSGKKACAVHGKFKFAEAKKKCESGEERINSILIILFGIKRIVHKEFILAAQPVNSMYYCDVLLH